MVTNNAWPMCSEPVTLGGGMTIEKGAFGVCASAWKYFCSSQKRYHFCSTAAGSYALGSSLMTSRVLRRRLRVAFFDETVELLADDGFRELGYHFPRDAL